jgi:hypothetical protein
MPVCDVYDVEGGCCELPSVLTAHGVCCCGTLDSKGQCCATPNELDACGVCGGQALYKDALGTCCTALDAKGMCCTHSDGVDAAGVCAGQNSAAKLSLLVTTPVEFTLNHFDDLAGTVRPLDATVQRLDSGVHTLSSLPAGGSFRVNLASNNPAAASFAVANYGNLGLTTQVDAAGVCGDGLCSVDEVCISGNEASCCIADCRGAVTGASVRTCEADDGSICSDRGTCVLGIGAADAYCVCAQSYRYSGAVCELCAAGFVDVGGECVRPTVGTCFDGKRNAQETGVDCGGPFCDKCPDAASIASESVLGAAVGGAAGGLAGLALIFAAVKFIQHRRNRSTERRQATVHRTSVSNMVPVALNAE